MTNHVEHTGAAHTACEILQAARVNDMNRSNVGRWPVLSLLILMMSWAASATAADTSDAVARCNSMRNTDLSSDPDTPARVYNAVVGRFAADVPEVCTLTGYIVPNIGFEIALPLANWNGKYFQGGCGGACGTTRMFWCDEPLRRGYACASTDMGHKSTTGDWNWAANNLQTKVDFGYRATHLTALVGKALTALYFNKQPTRAYFAGCSTGGRQALVEAQHYPWDFDGIIAGAAPLDQTGTAIQLAWTVLANQDADGKPIMTEPVVKLLHEAVIKSCDMNDGVADRLIGDPRRCKFDIEQLRCGKGGTTAECMSDAQIAAAKKFYSGPIDSNGQPIGRTGGAMLGSELNWLGDYLYGKGRAPQYATFIESVFQHLAFDPAPGTRWKLSDLNPERDVRRLANEMIYNASNPDLRRFKSKGGKLIGFQGWGDTSVVPMQYVDYYETVTRTMGGEAATLDFFRFFAVPGMRHCSSDSTGGDSIDMLTALEQWVEQGKAPDSLTGYNFDWTGLPLRSHVWPLDPARVKFSRPAYPYPAVPVYKGRGDPKQAENFKPSR